MAEISIALRIASDEDLSALTPLFDAYRIFYGHSSDPQSAKAFLSERLSKADSTIILAAVNRVPAGFCQLYRQLSSVSMSQYSILNDLFVASKFRGLGVAEKLMQEAERETRDSGFDKIALETGIENHAAQSLYSKRGWSRDATYVFSKRLAY